jgi:hypothetical protein
LRPDGDEHDHPDGVNHLVFRCRATISGAFLSWPLIRATLSADAIELDAPEVSPVLRRLGINVPFVVRFSEIVSARESRSGTISLQIRRAEDLRDLRADRTIEIRTSAQRRQALVDALTTAGVTVS